MVYPLDEVLLLALLAVLAGADGFTDFAWFGVKTLALLRRFRPSLMEPLPMIPWVIFLPRSTLAPSSAALCAGLRR